MYARVKKVPKKMVDNNAEKSIIIIPLMTPLVLPSGDVVSLIILIELF